jgi:hypothetical protein
MKMIWMPGRVLRGMGWVAWMGAILLGSLAAPDAARGNEMQVVFEQGRALFFQGKFREAKPLLQQVAAADPRHVETQAMLARIKLQEKQGPTLADKLASVTLETVDFSDVTVPEALEGLKELARAASAGKVVPNFIVRGEAEMPQRINLNLKNIPLTDAIKYVAGVSKTVCRYEANAVVFSRS